jgi:hypothetical protein
VEDSEMLSLVNSIDQKNRRIVQLVGLVQQREESMRTDQQFLYEVAKRDAMDSDMIDE